MKKTCFIMILIAVFVFGGCAVLPSGNENVTDYGYVYSEKTTISENSDEISTEEFLSTDIFASGTEITPENTTVSFAEITTEKQTDSVSSTEKQTEQQTEKETAKDNIPSLTEVDLTISMPSKNGTMKTDKAADNKFIEIVANERGIKKNLLVAVFSEPESGQNYVFEFYSSEGRDVDDLRRVYLINSDGEITGVAASKSNEKEYISSVENWFSMNVLIKEVIFPAIEIDIKS